MSRPPEPNFAARLRPRLLLLALGFCLAVGCASSGVGELELASTQPVSKGFETVKEGVEGRVCRQMALFIPLGSSEVTLEAAVEAALADAPGANALRDATTRQTLIPAILYNEVCWVVEGTAVRVR